MLFAVKVGPVNRQLRLAKRPAGEVEPDDFEVTEEELPPAGEDHARVKVLQVSLDPAMRGWMTTRPRTCRP
jgi:NADPH-dependent curcumin reductase CurA